MLTNPLAARCMLLPYLERLLRSWDLLSGAPGLVVRSGCHLGGRNCCLACTKGLQPGAVGSAGSGQILLSEPQFLPLTCSADNTSLLGLLVRFSLCL